MVLAHDLAPHVMSSFLLMGCGTTSSAPAPAPSPSYTGPLDLTATPAVVAYGQRAMKAAQIGGVIYTVRRDSDDATMAFPSTASGGVDPVAVLAWAAGANVFVTAWSDGSGNANNAVQATAGLQPQWVSSFSGGRPGIKYMPGAATMALVTGSAVDWSSGALTVFAVLDFLTDGASTGGAFMGQNWQGTDAAGTEATFQFNSALSAPNAPAFSVEGPSPDFLGPEWGSNDQAISLTSPTVVDTAFSPSSGALAVNGTNDAGFTNAGTTDAPGGTPQLLVIGNDDAANLTLPDNWHGHIVELIVYGSKLSSSDRTAIRQNIATWYGITLS